MIATTIRRPSATAGEAPGPARRPYDRGVEYERPPLERLQKALSWSFRVGRAFGSEVRVYGTAGFVWLLSVYELSRFTGFVEAVALGTMVTVGLYVVVWTHEMGHAFAGRTWGIRTPRITLSVFGGLAHMDAPVPGPKADVLVSLAGPSTHLLWLAVVWPLSLVYEPRPPPSGWVFDPLWFFLHQARVANLGMLLFNLLPVYPLDGGRAFRGLLATRMHANRATILATRVGMVGGVLFVAWGLAERAIGGVILMGIGLMVLTTSWSAYLGARRGDGPYGPPRDPWAFDDDAWRRGDSPAGDEGSRPGFFERRRAAKERAREEARQAAMERDEAELDRLLARVGEAGIAGLTDRERATLQRLSATRRR